MRSLILAMLLFTFMGAEANARWTPVRNAKDRQANRQANRRNGRSYSTSNAVQKSATQKSAAQKASYSARYRIKGHLGGGYGGYNAEGFGFSSHSARAALNNCCFMGVRRLASSSVVKGADGWYAVAHYW